MSAGTLGKRKILTRPYPFLKSAYFPQFAFLTGSRGPKQQLAPAFIKKGFDTPVDE